MSEVNELFIFEKHYQRKENQLFPKLEEKGFTGPTTVMWGKQDEIRAVMKELKQSFETDVPFSSVQSLFKTLKKKILIPTSLKKLTKAKATTFGGWSEATLPARPCNRGGHS